MKKPLFYLMAVVVALSVLFVACDKDKGEKKEPPQDDKEGVVINGIRWATRNVDKPGTFAANPEDAGMLYQWNRKVGWSSAYPMINSDGGTEWIERGEAGDVWDLKNDPCPCGWRVPTRKEFESLATTGGGIWNEEGQRWEEAGSLEELNGITGRFFGNGKQTIFLPAAGERYYGNGTLNSVGTGHYWSSDTYMDYAYGLYFSDDYFYMYFPNRAIGMTIRCVAE